MPAATVSVQGDSGSKSLTTTPSAELYEFVFLRALRDEESAFLGERRKYHTISTSFEFEGTLSFDKVEKRLNC